MACWAIVTAGGVGRRMGTGVSKQFLSLGSKPILRVTLENISAWGGFSGIVVTAPEEEVEATRRIAEDAALPVTVTIVPGGDTRQLSVLSGLMALEDAAEDDLVFIHDGVRPFPPIEKFDELVKSARPDGAILAVGCTDTVKRAPSGTIKDTLVRDELWLAQTPQVFPYGRILSLHKKASKENLSCTDDASLVEMEGGSVKIVESTQKNLKVTTPEDLLMARMHLGEPSLSLGHGYDVHKLVEGRDLVLGGVRIEHEKGLLGHSDADVVAHALADACLGAAGMGDIGRHFPDSDPRYKGADSIKLLEEVARKIGEKGLRVVRADITLIAQRPKIAPYVSAMEEKLATALGLGEGGVTLKATTTEGLGFEGREEGISAHAVAFVGPSL